MTWIPLDVDCDPNPNHRIGAQGALTKVLRVLSAFLLSFGVIFVAELGDKSQLMAMTFATRYKPLPILMSQLAARQRPPPIAAPLIAAITG